MVGWVQLWQGKKPFIRTLDPYVPGLKVAVLRLWPLDFAICSSLEPMGLSPTHARLLFSFQTGTILAKEPEDLLGRSLRRESNCVWQFTLVTPLWQAEADWSLWVWGTWLQSETSSPKEAMKGASKVNSARSSQCRWCLCCVNLDDITYSANI